MKKHLKMIVLFAISFAIVQTSYLLAAKPSKLISKNQRAIFKAKYIPPNKKIIRVEIEIFDDTSKDYNDISYVDFNNEKINLLKPSASGLRGRKYFQMNPGKYIIEWRISKGSFSKWPREETYRKKLLLKKNQTYVHILIKGDKIIIS